MYMYRSMAAVILLACIFCLFFSVNSAVLLTPSGNVSVCLNGGITLACSTEGALLWKGDKVNEVFDMIQAPVTEGNFTLVVTSVTASRVNSTATLYNFQGEQDGLTISCIEISTGSRQMAVLREAGPPSAPAVNPITFVGINSTLLISWSQSNCTVQYVVTIINSSDDRVYPNITTNSTNTTVTLPTGVEFCVTLVAVDSIGRRGPDTTPVCYHQRPYASISIGETVTPTVTQSPTMMGGINVAAAVAIPVVLVLLLLVIGVVVVVIILFLIQQRKSNYGFHVFCKESGTNKWKIAIVFFAMEHHQAAVKYVHDQQYKEYNQPVNDILLKLDESFVVSHEKNEENDKRNKWKVTVDQEQVTRACIDEYTGEDGKPPVCEITVESSNQRITPPDLNLPITISGPRKFLHTFNFSKEAKSAVDCVYQVFYKFSTVNGKSQWKAQIAFFPKSLDERCQKHFRKQLNYSYVDLSFEDKTGVIAAEINKSSNNWEVVITENHCRVERTTVESCSGDKAPPYIEVTVTPAGNNVDTFPDLACLVKFTGMEQPHDIVLNKGEDCVCQVFRQDVGWNKLIFEFAFFPKKCLEDVRHTYQSVYVGDKRVFDLDFLTDTIEVIPPLHLRDWKVTVDTQEVDVADVNNSVHGKPPCCKMTVQPKQVKTTPQDLRLVATMKGLKKPKAIELCKEAQFVDLICQVFYHRHEIISNCWRVTLAVFPKRLDKKVNELYQDAHNCPPVDLDMEDGSLSASEPKKIPGWTVTFDKNQRIKRSTVELYDGIVEPEPPSWKLTVQASSANDAIADLNETVTLTDNSTLLSKKKWTIPITRMAGKLSLTTPPANWVKSPGNVLCACQVLYHRVDTCINNWRVTFAFFPNDKHDRVLELYQDANIGPHVNTKITYFTFMKSNRPWKPVFSSQKDWKLDHGKQMSRDSMKNFYDGVGRPPFCEITAKADKSNPPNLSFSVNFGDHIKKLKIERTAEIGSSQNQ